LEPEPVHPVEADTRQAQPGLGTGDVSPCLPGWIKTFCEKYERGEGYVLSHSAVGAVCHTLIAARVRAARLIRERDEAREKTK
jgi:hypothetical protein